MHSLIDNCCIKFRCFYFEVVISAINRFNVLIKTSGSFSYAIIVRLYKKSLFYTF